ncbi:hypothetical protein ABPG73_013987 [Tetrahymena malaccensis]
MQKLMKLAMEFQEKEKLEKGQKKNKKKVDQEIGEDGDANSQAENDDDDDEEEEIKAREGCSLAYDALNIKFVQEENDLNPLFKKNMLFKPNYVHQIYGQEEEIEGYEDLQINIYMLSGSLHTLIEYSYGKKMKQHEDFLQKLRDNCFVSDFCLKRKEFNQHMNNEKSFKPIGDKFKEITAKNGEKFEIYYCNTQKHPEFSEYKKRMQVFAKFYIEVGSYIEDNEYWHHFLIYHVDQNGMYTFAGFTNKYEYMFNINKSRHQISQIVILPIFQRLGLATELLNCHYKTAQEDSKCLELTVEDPSPEFQIVRDIIETKLVIDGKFWEWFEAIRPKTIRGILQLEGIKISHEKEITQATKIPKYQIQRIFEILMLSKLDQSNKQLMDRYRGHFIKYRKDINEVRTQRKVPYIIFDNKAVKIDVQAIIEQKKQLEPNDAFYLEEYEQTLEQYNNVIQKLKI